jgi:hypothetical protein
MYFPNDKQHLWCNFLTFFWKKKIENKYLTNLTSHFFLFEDFKDFRIIIQITNLNPITIFNKWKFESKSSLKSYNLLKCHFQTGLNDLICFECKVKKKNDLSVSKFNPMFLFLAPKWAKFLLFMSIYKKIDSNYNKELTKDSKINSKLILKNNCSDIGRLVKKLRNVNLITKFENFGFLKFKKKEIKTRLLIFYSKTSNYQNLPKIKVFKQISKFIFLQIFQQI